MNAKQFIPGLTYLLLFSLFFQTRFAPFGKIHFILYLIPFIYLSDLLIIFLSSLITLNYFSQFKVTIQNLWQSNKHLLILWFLFLITGASANLQAQSPLIAWFILLKLVLFSFFSLLVFFLLSQKIISPKNFWLSLDIGLLLECFVAIGEFITKKSLGLQLLGEWQFSIFTPGIAKTIIFGQEFLRPYATFPHPNVLGTITAILAVINLFFLLAITSSKQRDYLPNFFFFLVFSLTTLLSFSRTAWFCYLTLILIILLIQKIPVILKILSGLIIAITIVVLIKGILLHINALPISQRFDLTLASLQIIKNHPLGVGLSNFTLLLQPFGSILFPNRLFEPVHNLWLLVTAEAGIIGLIFFGTCFFLLLKKSFLNKNFIALIMLLGILLTSFTDHFWWTLQPGQLFFWLTIGVALTHSNAPNS